MWPNIIGLLAGSKARDDLRLRDFRAEVARCERRQAILSALRPTARPTLIFDSNQDACSPPTVLSSMAGLMPQYRHPVTSRHPPTPTCCPQEPGGHLRQRYSPWIRANHLQCQFPSKRDGSVDNGSDDENPSSSSHTDTGRNPSLTLSNTTFANVNGGSAGPEPEPESTTDITTMSGDESTVEPEVELTCIGRFQHVSNVDLKWLKNKIEQEFHGPGTFSFFGTRMLSIDDHPLVQQYNKRRAAMIAAGEPAPEELSLDKLEWSLANKMNLRSSPSTVHIDHNGTEVHTGFRGPPLVRRSSSYSNCDTFAKWRFADADVNFDTEVTRLKEFGDSRASSTVKLVLAEQRDPVVGTGPFMEANKPATQPQSKMLNDEFNQFLQNHKRTIKFSSDVDLAKAKQTVTASAVSTDSESEDDPDSLILSKPSDDTDGTNQTDLTSSDTDTTTLTKIEDVRAPRSPSQLKTSKRVYDLYAYWIEASNENGEHPTDLRDKPKIKDLPPGSLHSTSPAVPIAKRQRRVRFAPIVEGE